MIHGLTAYQARASLAAFMVRAPADLGHNPGVRSRAASLALVVGGLLSGGCQAGAAPLAAPPAALTPAAPSNAAPTPTLMAT
ncbi:MAG: hypothetical protein M3336_12190, partial [Chloroflexota bacterium]|nr:hypothetical protein [Chloroflexota bacterium]